MVTLFPPVLFAAHVSFSTPFIENVLNVTATRPEDMAYCLLGSFDVRPIPMYDELQAKTFRRLQADIIKTSRNQSPFAWRKPLSEREKSASGLFAHQRAHAHNARAPGKLTDSFTLDNTGFRLSLPFIRDSSSIFAVLACESQDLSIVKDNENIVDHSNGLQSI